MSYAWADTAFGQRVAPGWRPALATVALVWGALLALFHHDVADIAGIYWNSTTFGHCLFVPPVIGWLVWQRKTELAQLTPVGWWPGLLLVGAGAGGWFLGDVAGVAFARHLGLVLMLQGALAATLGPNVSRGLLFPLGYMVFLVPFGEFLEAPLQTMTVVMTMWGLYATNVPAIVDGVLITIPNGYFEVAEACSGAKFVIAMLAYATLVANLCYIRWGRRIAFFAMAMIVPVLANGVRAWGTIYAAHLTSVETAAGADHIIYGWVFFGLVMALVLAIGWRWFDRDPEAPAFDPATLQAPVARTADRPTVAAAVLAIAASALLLGGSVSARADTLPPRLSLPDVPGWRRVGMSTRAPWSPYYPTADHMLTGRYADAAGVTVDVAVAVFAGQREGRELVAFGQGVLRENDRWVRVMDEAPLAGGTVMRITAPGPVERAVATWYRVGGASASSPRDVKVETLKAKLLGGSQRGVALHLSAEAGLATSPRAAIARFLAAAGPADALADRIAAAR